MDSLSDGRTRRVQKDFIPRLEEESRYLGECAVGELGECRGLRSTNATACLVRRAIPEHSRLVDRVLSFGERRREQRVGEAGLVRSGLAPNPKPIIQQHDVRRVYERELSEDCRCVRIPVVDELLGALDVLPSEGQAFARGRARCSLAPHAVGPAL